MEATLVVVTLLSLALAIGMAIVTWRVLQHERARADARVAVLEEGLATSLATSPVASSAAMPSRTFEPEAAAVPAVFSGLAAEAADADTDTFAAERLFAREDATAFAANGRSRGLFVTGVAVVAIALILALWSVGRLLAPGAEQRAAATTAAASAVAGQESSPLELVSLEQTREGDALTVRGVVRNPPGGVTTDRLAAVVAFFDAGGQQLASVRAPLDFRTLAPGDESPFQVTTTVPAGVARYRVSFRRDEGTIVPHVDRRQQEAS
jgi:hypothetical protein